MAPTRSSGASRRAKIGATVGALGLVAAAGGYGTYAAFTDTTTLDGTAAAGTVQINDPGADSRTITVAGLVPGDAPNTCFTVAAPASGNTQDLNVALVATDLTQASTANTALAGALTVGIERVAGTGATGTENGANGSTQTLTRTSDCQAVPAGSGTTPTSSPQTVSGIAALTDTFTLAPGARQTYRVTLRLGANAPQAAQGGSASFRLQWTGSAGVAAT
ncbi:TasA family protein [Patulibacter sp. SYSU D01012]|uniref:TasA family protein n=1 Tax=Patulibacter sp. SYSU D01012 TaxID=2817381 RepID=UPI001B304E6D|nr:TasA family protein [Patulibacter sp. SYSU D01012]